jgi:hypothetical protein
MTEKSICKKQRCTHCGRKDRPITASTSFPGGKVWRYCSRKECQAAFMKRTGTGAKSEVVQKSRDKASPGFERTRMEGQLANPVLVLSDEEIQKTEDNHLSGVGMAREVEQKVLEKVFSPERLMMAFEWSRRVGSRFRNRTETVRRMREILGKGE